MFDYLLKCVIIKQKRISLKFERMYKNEIEVRFYNDEGLSDIRYNKNNYEDKQINFENKKVFIYFGEKNHIIQNGEVLKDKSNDPNNVVVQFNYPGVMGSKGKFNSSKDLVDSGIEIIKCLLERGVKLDDIHLHGYELGGAIATIVAKKINVDTILQKQNYNRKENNIKQNNNEEIQEIIEPADGQIKLT